MNLLDKGASPMARCRESMATVWHVAAANGSTEALSMLMARNGESVESGLTSRDSYGRQPHHLAAASNHIEALKMLLQSSPHLLNSKTTAVGSLNKIEEDDLDSYLHDHAKVTSLLLDIPEGSTALHVAAVYSHSEITKWLLDENADINETDSNNQRAIDVLGRGVQSSAVTPKSEFAGFDQGYRGGARPMTRAMVRLPSSTVPKLYSNILNMLIGKSASPSGHSGGQATTTNLHVFVNNSDVESMRLFLDHLDSQNLPLDSYTRRKDDKGRTPVLLAVEKRKLKEMRILLEKDNESVNVPDDRGMTPLHLAVIESWKEGIEVLLQFNPDVNTVLSDTNENVFHSAAKMGYLEILQTLLHYKDESALQAMDIEGYTPLTRAIQSVKASVAIVKTLLMVSDQNLNGILLIAKAIEADSVEKLDFLKTYFSRTPDSLRSDLSFREGMSALHYSVWTGSLACMKYLISLDGFDGIDAQVAGAEGGTIAHVAARYDRSEALFVILKEPKSVHLLSTVDVRCREPLIVALSEGSVDSIEVLLKNGANIAAEDPEKKKNALQLMTQNIPYVESMITDVLNSYVHIEHGDGRKKDSRIELGYKFLLADSHFEESPQLGIVETFLKFNNPDVNQAFFSHPLVDSFLCLNEQLRCFFDMIVMLFIAHIFFLTVLSLTTYTFKITLLALLSTIGLWASVVPVIIMEILITMDDLKYITDKEAVIKWTVLIGSILLAVFSGQWWSRYLASVTVVLAWIELLFLLGNSPKYGGIRILMFFEVATNVLQVLSSFIYLILGFAFGFLILFDGGYPFNNIWTTITKMLIMMVELDYSGAFGEDNTDYYSPAGIIGRLIYLCFVVLVVMVMSNLMVSMSVSDVSQLESSGKAKKNQKEAKYLILFEKIMYKNKCFPGFLRLMFRKKMGPVRKEMITVYPYNRKMEHPKLPESLRNEIISCYFKAEKSLT